MPVFRRTFSLVLLFALALAAVGQGLAPARAQDTGTITIGMTDLPNTLDPGEAYDFAAWEVLCHLYTGLTRQVPGTFDYELALAESYTVSEDRLTYTFTLRDDAVFTDGTPITAQTFVDSITRVRALKEDAEQAIEPYVAAVDATGSGELVFHLTRPVPYFLALLALPPYFPVHPILVAKTQPVPYPQALIGNGPFLLESFTARTEIVLTANPDYAYGPPATTSTIVLRRYEKSQDLREALRDHNVDLAWHTLFLQDVIDLAAEDDLTLIETPSTRVFYMYMCHDRDPFDDPLVREAITYLIDRQSAVDTVFSGHLTPLTSMIPSEFADAYAPIWPDSRDQERAEDVLRAAAYSPRGTSRLTFTVLISFHTYGNLFVSAVNQLYRTSFSPSDFVESGIYWDVETDAMLPALERGEAPNMVFGWTPIVPHPAAYLRPLVHSAETIPSSGRYASTETDTLLDEAALLDDPVEQGARYRDVSEWLLARYDIIPLWQEHLQVVAWKDINGIQLEPNFFLHYDQLARAE
ncbi:MAG: hypothetical protein JXJ20_11210 [Anaerolineae bacterium]|nr:hypothetical protein [Anaerolineae bacterium]